MAATIPAFHDRLIELGEDPAEAAVLARTNQLVDELNQTTQPKTINPRAQAIAPAVHALRLGITLGRRDLGRIDLQLAEAAWDMHDLTELDTDGRWALGRATMALLTGAPEPNGTMHSWTGLRHRSARGRPTPPRR